MSDLSFNISPGFYLKLEVPGNFEATQGSRTIVGATEIFAGALGTIIAKDRLYGGAWRDQGWMGNLARIMSKTARLRSMLWRDAQISSADEPVRDTLQDMINLCVFMLLNMQRANKWGRGDV